jgi:hypothetical protein
VTRHMIADGVGIIAEGNTRPRWSHACEYTYMCSRLGGTSRLIIQVAPPVMREGHPKSAIPAKYTCVREGM